MTHAWTHAWCKSPARDEAVRAAEDGRDRPLPTLAGCIETAFSAGVRDSFRKVEEAWAMIPKSVSASSPVDQENKGDGMTDEIRKQRITLEIECDAIIHSSQWPWTKILRDGGVIGTGESVRVVEDDRILAASKKLIEVDQEAALRGFDTTTFQRLWISAIARVLGLELARPPRSKCDNPGDGSIPSAGILASPALVEAHQQIAALTAERDAAIRERESWKLLADRTNERLSAAEARVAELEAASGGGEQPRGWLTASDRHELEEIVVCLEDDWWSHSAAFVRSLLARNAPPKVRLPTEPMSLDKAFAERGWEKAIEAVRAALAAAGVEVELPPGPEGDG